MTVCSCHVTYAVQSESTLYSCLNVKELFARSRREIWSLSDCNWTRTQNHLVRKHSTQPFFDLWCRYRNGWLKFQTSRKTCFDFTLWYGRWRNDRRYNIYGEEKICAWLRLWWSITNYVWYCTWWYQRYPVYIVPLQASGKVNNCNGTIPWGYGQTSKSKSFTKGPRLLYNCRGSYCCAM